MSKINLGIVIVNYLKYLDTKNCIENIIKTTKVDFKIVVVDNHSSNQSLQYLSNLYKDNSQIIILSSNANNGYSAGNNIGIKYAERILKCTEILITNPDVIFFDNSIEIMLNKLILFSEIGVIGPKVLDVRGEVQHYARGVFSFKNYLCIKKPFNYISSKNKQKYENLFYNYQDDLVFSGMVSGCCFMAKSSIFREIEYFDENVFLFYEEDIIGLKLSKKGYLSCICHDAKVIHDEGSSTKLQGTAFINFHRYVSAYYVLIKYVSINYIQHILLWLINLGAFTLRSLYFKDYRKYLMKLLIAYFKLLRGTCKIEK